MSDLNEFCFMKDSIKNNAISTYALALKLHQDVSEDKETNSPQLGQDARTSAIVDLAIADYKADYNDGVSAKIMYSEALNLMKDASKAGSNVKQLEQIADVVGRRIP